MFIDTHIVSYAKAGRLHKSISGARISSIAASELLLVNDERRTAARYYVPAVSSDFLRPTEGNSIASMKRDHPFSKKVSDHIIFDFGKDFNPIVQFGSRAISRMINTKDARLLNRCISFLDKRTRKLIQEDFDMLIQNDIECVPLDRGSIDIAHWYLDRFITSGEAIKTTFRNTWNDLLILSTACTNGGSLWSMDKQLNRFAGSQFGRFEMDEPSTIKIDLHIQGNQAPSSNINSKGYVNRGWRVLVQKRMNQAW